MNCSPKTRMYHILLYIQGDALNLPKDFSASFDVVLDKGTLDAIASGAEDDTEAPNRAMRYIQEVWRALLLEGRLIIITTMPREIIEALAMQYIDVHDSDWSTSSKQEVLKTSGEGTVYYYCITKVGSGHLKTPVENKDAIVRGIQDILQSALKESQQFTRGDGIDPVCDSNSFIIIFNDRLSLNGVDRVIVYIFDMCMFM